MKNKFISYSFVLIFGATILFTAASCNKKKDESELITTVELQIKKGGNPYGTFTWTDKDGPGGANPVLPDTLRLDSSFTYTCSLIFKNESGNQSTDITQEVRDEGADHFICFTVTPAIAEIVHTDSDGQYSIGLESQWTAKNKGKAMVRVVLRHQPNGAKNGSCDPGETDADVEFPIEIL